MNTEMNRELPDIDLSPLQRTLGQFEIAITAWAAAPDDARIRDAVIQRFEFTYELSIRKLLRYLRHTTHFDNDVNQLTLRQLIQRAADTKLGQADVLVWPEFRQARTDTVQTYNESRAVEVAGAAKTFAGKARFLLDRLKEKIQP